LEICVLVCTAVSSPASAYLYVHVHIWALFKRKLRRKTDISLC